MRLSEKTSERMKWTLGFLMIALIPVAVNFAIGTGSGQSRIFDKSGRNNQVSLAISPEKFPSYLYTVQNHVSKLARSVNTTEALHELSNRFSYLQKDLEAGAKRKQLEEIRRFYAETFAAEYHSQNGENVQVDQFVSKLDPPSVPAQYDFIVSNEYPLGKKQELLRPRRSTPYAEAHAKFHPLFQDLLETHSLYDVFLIGEDGRVVYSVFKEIDFATSLVTGPWSATGLAKAFQATRSLKPDSPGNGIHYEDFSAYVPSYDAPAAFVSAPLFREGKYIGALVVQIPLEKVVRSKRVPPDRIAQLSF